MLIPECTFGKTVAATLVVLALLGALPGFAQQCVVTNTSDSSPGSLRAAIGDASCTSIVFGLGSYPATITLSSGELLINRSLTIAGPGAKNLTILGTSTTRVFHIVGASAVVAISGLTMRDGYGAYGGGIYLESGTLTLTNSLVTGNAATEAGGILASGGTLNVTNSTVFGNFATHGGGIVLRQQGTLNLNNSTVVGNRALTLSGPSGGGGISVSGATANLANSTIAGNYADYGAGIAALPPPAGGATAVTLKNTLLAQVGARNCHGNAFIHSQGYNLSDDNTCSSLVETGDLQNTSAGFDPDGWGDNGGPTPTWALLANSPAVDAVGETACTDTSGNPVRTDQRGVPRPLGPRCDMGAFEFGKEVVIDIKPGAGPNSINLGSEGKVPVAICSSPVFDPRTVNPYNILLAGASVALKGKALTPMASYEYLSVGACSLDNTYPDLVVHIDTQTVTLTPGAVEAFVTGMTTATPPMAIFGKDSVQIVPPGN